MQQPPNQPPFEQPGQGPQQQFTQHPQYPPQGYQQPLMQQFPQPQPPKKKTWYRKPWGIVLIIFLILFACGGIANAITSVSGKGTASIVTPTDTPVPTDTPAPADTPAPTNTPSTAGTVGSSENVAASMVTLDSLNPAYGVTIDDPTIAKYKNLLDTLHTKTGESVLTIGNETQNGQTVVKNKYNQDVSLLELMQQTNDSIPDGTNIKYSEALAAYIILRYDD